MEPTLYSDQSFDSLVIRWMVLEKDCRVEFRIVDPWEVSTIPLPSLRDRDLHVVAHWPMVQYLQERYPGEPLLPVDPKIRAQIRQICWLVRRAKNSFVQDAEDMMGHDNTFVAGDEFTLADVYAGARLHLLVESGKELPPRAARYYKNLAGREAFKEAIG